MADFGFVRLSVICFRNSAHADEPVERNQLICRCVVLWRLYIGSVDADYYRAVIDVVFWTQNFWQADFVKPRGKTKQPGKIANDAVVFVQCERLFENQRPKVIRS